MRLKLLLITIALFVGSLGVYGQVTIAIQDFEAIAPTPTWSYTGTASITATPSKFNGAKSLQLSTSNTVTFDNINISGYTSVILSVAFASVGADSGEDLFIDISYDNGTTWTGTGSIKLVDGFNNANININATNALDPTTVGSNPYPTSISSSETQISIRFRPVALDANEFYFIDDVKLTGILSSGCSAPTTQASNISFSSITSSSLSLNWTNGNGAGRIILMNTSNSFTTPTNGFNPSANITYNGSGEQVIYNGTDSGAITINGLTAGNIYHFRVYEYCSPDRTYQTTTTTNNPNNVFVPKPEPTNYPTTFACGATTSSSIPLTWTTATGAVTPDGYLVKWSSTSYAAIVAPSDGIAEANGATTQNVVGTSHSVAGLSSSTTYYFKIWSYTNSGSSINYKLVSEPQTSCATLTLPNVVITEYAGSGLGGNFNDEYIEISNFGSSSVDLSGWTLEYYNNSALEVTLNLTGSLSANAAYVIAARTTYTAALTPNFVPSSSFSMNSTGYAILKMGTTTIDQAASSGGKFSDAKNYELKNCPSDNSVVANWDDLGTGNGTPGIVNCVVICTPPTTQAASFTSSAIAATTATVGWTRGNGNNVLVVARATGAVNADPTNGTNYSANAAFGSGTQIGTGNYVVYKGNGSSINLTNLVVGSTYHFAVYEYFDTDLCHNLTQLTGNFTIPITNNLCGGAAGLTVNAAVTAASMTGSTATAPFTEKDVWFSFTPTCSGTHNITVAGFSGDIDIELYATTCPSSTTAYLDYSEGYTSTETITYPLTAGTIYYLRVLAFDNTAETSAFTAQVTSTSTLAINNTGSPAEGLIVSGTSNVVLMGFTTTPNCSSSYDLTSVKITKSGSSTSSDIDTLRIFYDANSNGIIDGGEASVSGTGIVLANSMTFTLTGQTGITTSRNYLLVANVLSGATGGREFTGKITTSNNLTAVLTPAGTITGTADGNLQTIIYAGAEINVTNNNPSGIPSGSAASTGFNTQFAATAIGVTTAAKTYRIYNLGSATLNVSSVTSSNSTEFAVNSSSTYNIAPGAYVTFTVTFTPSSAGPRTALISIVNNDSTGSENPYTFSVNGIGTCVASTNTITPTSGPIGTEITISSANLTGGTVTIGGIVATVYQISSTQIKAVVPVGATSGSLITTNALGCTATNAFTVLDNTANTCQGGSNASELFISEVTDESFGSMTYIEIFNGTGAPVNLATSNYKIKVYNNGNASAQCDLALTGTIANNDVFILSIGGAKSSEAGGVVPDQTEDGCTAINSNDNIRLFKGATLLDQWGFTTDTKITGVTEQGFTGRRLNTATQIPSVSFDEADWEIIDAADDAAFDSAVDYTNVGTYNFIAGTPPAVTIPVVTANCKTASFTVTGTEGYNGAGDSNELTYQWYVNAPNSASWTSVLSTGVYTGSTTATLAISDNSALNNYQYYCEVRESLNTCSKSSNAVKIDVAITWDGTNWRDSNNAITTTSINKLALINSNYDTSTSGNFDACSVVVNSPYILTITANKYVKIQNDLTNNGVLTIENDGSLVQVDDDGVNTGNITYERDYTGISTYDYTYWSSPVANQNLLAVSPTTKTDKFFSFDAATTNDWLQENPSTRTMEIGKGYIIRAAPISGIPPGWLTNSFIGVPNNGKIDVPIYWNGATDGTSNLIGNPYPCAIDAIKFLTANTSAIESTIYFWTNATDFLQSPSDIIANGGTPGSGTLAYTSNDYASFNLTGGVGVGVGNTTDGTPATEVVSNKPDGKIAAGQAFFTTSLTNNTNSTATFNNSMRLDKDSKVMDNSQFFKTRNPKTKTTTFEKHRIWLNLTNTQGAFKQTLVGYITDATNEYDTRFDGESFDGNEFVDFYSINQEKNLVIQGRALPFDENDQVPLGFRTTITGAFTIKIDQADGVLTNQAVFIEDKLTNTIFDLRSGPFIFNTAAGTFNDRFVLRYTNKTLGTNDLETLENQVLVSNKNKQIKINSKAVTIDKVMVYDLLGRLLFKKEKVNNTEFSILSLISNSETLLVKVTLQNGEMVTRKILY